MGRNIEMNRKMKGERRAKILSSALKLFSTKGLSATKISDIAKDSNASQGLVYHYYTSKDEIYSELITSAFKKLISACDYLEELDISPDEKIRMAVTELLKGIETDEDASRFHLLIARASVSDSIPEKARKTIMEKNLIPYEVISRIIKAGQETGSIKNKHNAEEMSTAFWASIKGLAISKAVHGIKLKMPDPAIIYSMFIKENHGDTNAEF